jgi:hypothetical protein
VMQAFWGAVRLERKDGLRLFFLAYAEKEKDLGSRCGSGAVNERVFRPD